MRRPLRWTLAGIGIGVLTVGVGLILAIGFVRDVPLRSETLKARIVTEQLDFRGTLWIAAKVSQTQSGLKSVLLKAVDPLFRKPGGGSAIPIKISGRRVDPQFGLDMGCVFKRGDDF